MTLSVGRTVSRRQHSPCPALALTCTEAVTSVERSGAVHVCLDRTEGSSQPPGEWTDDTAQLRL